MTNVLELEPACLDYLINQLNAENTKALFVFKHERSSCREAATENLLWAQEYRSAQFGVD